VHEGQIVKPGEPLVRLDDTRFRSNAGETKADRLSLEARIQRLTAQLNDAQTLTLAPEIVNQAPEIADGEMKLFASVKNRIQGEIGGLEEQLVQKKQDLLDFRAKEGQYRNSLSLLRQEIRMSEPLVAEGGYLQSGSAAPAPFRGGNPRSTGIGNPGYSPGRSRRERDRKQDCRNSWPLPQRGPFAA
jgi:multidrug efflux pump subunit AcrA (membrane-fusion protein)